MISVSYIDDGNLVNLMHT